MLFEDSYQTIDKISEAIFREKGSKFMAYAYPIVEENAVKPILLQLRNDHPKAVHFCFAFRLTPDRNIFKFSDDGEPAGTAGRPILNTLLSANLTNVLVVVVRYFGGTLLGVPGLINAYKTATQIALKENEIVTKTVSDSYEIHFSYVEMNNVMRVMKEEQLQVLEQKFDTECVLQFSVRKLMLNGVLAKLEKIDGLSLRYLRTI